MTYGRLAGSELIEELVYKSGSGTTVVTVGRAYESDRDLLTSVTNVVETATPTTVSRYDYALDGTYTLDAWGRRRTVVHTGSAFIVTGPHNVKFEYNDRSELVDATRYDGTTQTTPLSGSLVDFDYAYDPIGNRDSSDVDDSNMVYYCDNAVNQYDKTSSAGDCSTTLEDFAYDDDGNMTADGAYTYVYDGENRLIAAHPTSPGAGSRKLVFAYDYIGRRVRKQVFDYDTQASDWEATPATDQRFVYDGWNVALVLDGTAGNAVTRKYTWGLDLSQSLHGAGGVGGLLAAVETGGANQGTYWFLYDGNGNVGQVLDATDTEPASDMRITAHYEYDPYGNPIKIDNDLRELDGSVDTADAGYATANPLRFSTKWLDDEIDYPGTANDGLYYYGHRYYAPRLGRWLNRDPIGERGGLNLYGFVGNRPTEVIDALGHFPCERVIGVLQRSGTPMPSNARAFRWITEWALLAAWPSSERVAASGGTNPLPVEVGLANRIEVVWLRQYSELCKCCTEDRGVILLWSEPNIASIKGHVSVKITDMIGVGRLSVTIKVPVFMGIKVPLFTWRTEFRTIDERDRNKIRSRAVGNPPGNTYNAGFDPIQWTNQFNGPDGMTDLWDNIKAQASQAPFPGPVGNAEPAALPWPANMPTIY